MSYNPASAEKQRQRYRFEIFFFREKSALLEFDLPRRKEPPKVAG
jgi:hypothetical protein